MKSQAKIQPIKDDVKVDDPEFGDGDGGGEDSHIGVIQCPECDGCSFKVLAVVSVLICNDPDCAWSGSSYDH